MSYYNNKSDNIENNKNAQEQAGDKCTAITIECVPVPEPLPLTPAAAAPTSYYVQQQLEQQQTQYDSASQQLVHDFVYRYYLTLAGAPHDAWRAYTVAAQYIHVDGELAVGRNDVRPVVGHHQIHQNIMHQNFYECAFHLRSVNIQQTPADAAHLVLVTGDMVRGRQQPVMFIQTFLVECIQEINQYAISNSIFKVYTFT